MTKLFLADREGEVFLNLNAPDHVGEFPIKDEDCATIVITELAKIMLRGFRKTFVSARSTSPCPPHLPLEVGAG